MQHSLVYPLTHFRLFLIYQWHSCYHRQGSSSRVFL